MTTLVFGIGIGLFIILSLWVLAALIFLISLRIERKVGAIAILIVSVLTIILISVPRASEKSATAENKVYKSYDYGQSYDINSNYNLVVKWNDLLSSITLHVSLEKDSDVL